MRSMMRENVNTEIVLLGESSRLKQEKTKIFDYSSLITGS